MTVTRPYVAYGYTTAYPRDAYMGLFISELHFYARSWTQDGDETKTPRITAMTVVLTVAKRDANNQIVPLCTQKPLCSCPVSRSSCMNPAPGTARHRRSRERCPPGRFLKSLLQSRRMYWTNSNGLVIL